MSEIQNIISPVVTYEHAKYQNRIDLVGTVHIAEPVYYQELQDFVDSRESQGATVHYEATPYPTPEQLAVAPRHVRRKVERISAVMGEFYGMLGEIDGLVTQTKGLTYRDSWENHDKTVLEMVEEMTRLTIDGLWAGVKLAKLANRLVGPDESQALMLQMLSNATAEKKVGLGERLTYFGREKHVVNARNVIALTALDEALETNRKQDMLLLWGAGHVEGLGEGVEKRGFVQINKRQLTAINVARILDRQHES